MAKLLERIKSIFHNRRHETESVRVERRTTKPSLKDADARLREAVEKLDHTVRMRRDDFYDRIERK